jgi:hypothetical protein
MGMESTICLFNVNNIPGLYNWITLSEIKKIDNIIIKSRDGLIIYNGSLSFERSANYLMTGYVYDFRPIEVSENDWILWNQNGYLFEFSSKFVIRSLREIKGIKCRLCWSGNEDYEKNVELLIAQKGFPLYLKEGSDYMQSFENIKTYLKKDGKITYANKKVVFVKKMEAL